MSRCRWPWKPPDWERDPLTLKSDAEVGGDDPESRADTLLASWPGLNGKTCGVETPPFERVRAIALALPGVSERMGRGEPCFFVGGTRTLCYFHDDHNGDGRVSLWCPAPPGVQDDLVGGEPAWFFRPPMSARGTFSTWLGVYLDGAGEDPVDSDEVGAIIEDAYRLAAPRVLLAELDSRA